MADSKALFMRYVEEFWNAPYNLDVADELYTPDHVYHDAALAGVELPPGPEGVKARGRIYLGAFPDMVVTADDWVVASDGVTCLWTAGGTNSGELMGMPPTGKQASCTGIHLCHLRDGRIAETWTRWDTLGLLQQLGLVKVGEGQAVG